MAPIPAELRETSRMLLQNVAAVLRGAAGRFGRATGEPLAREDAGVAVADVGAAPGAAPLPRSSDSTGRRLRVGIDIGGTFTDFLLADDSAGMVWVGKTLTTPEDPAISARKGLEDLLHRIGATGAEVAAAVHGTTLVTNAILERKGDRTALVTTRGFRDVIEIAREHRYDMYDIFLDLPRCRSRQALQLE